MRFFTYLPLAFSLALIMADMFIRPAPLAIADISIPTALLTGYVLDEAEILSDETEAALNTELATLETDTSTEIVVVSVKSLQGYAIEEYAIKVGRTWGVGQEEFNNGVVFLIAPIEQEARIEVGYGLEGAVTDAQSFAILDKVAIPSFSMGDYDQGVLSSVSYLDKLARGEEFDLPTSTESLDFGELLPIFIFVVLPLIWALFSWFSSTKSWWAGGIFGGIFGFFILGGLGVLFGAAIGLILDLLLSTYLFGKIKGPRGRGPGGIFLGGGRFGGGSSGGFGGGGFGGGGASGRW